MAILTALISTLLLSARRLWNHRVLMVCLLTGLIAAVGLLSSVPMYADATQNRLLQGELTDDGTTLPPFAFIWRYIGAWNGDIDADQYRPANTYLTDQAADVIGLPLESLVRHARTTRLRLFPDPSAQQFVANEPLLFASVGFVTGLADHIVLVEGTFPDDGGDGPTPVLVSEALADQLGVQVGETYVLFGQGQSGAQLPLTVAGLWRAVDSADTFWFYQPRTFDDVLLTSETAFFDQIAPALDLPIAQAVWYLNFDGSRVRTQNVPALVQGVRAADARVNALLNNTTLDTSPLPALETYGQSARVLTTLLTVFSIPIVGLVLYFISLIANMVVQRSQSEIAVLRSRGATRGQVVALYLLEGTLVGVLGLGGGMALGVALAQLMSRTRSFLDLSPLGQEPLPILLSPTAWLYGLIGVALAIVALLVPALVASRHTIVTFRWERARALLRPAWQRYFVDLLILAPPLYGWYLLAQQGTIAATGQSESPFANPLLFLVPALFCFAVSLLFVRLFPLLMGGLAWLVERLPAVAALITLRQLARAGTQYTGPLLLISLTLSLATFTASMALTLDDHLVESRYYAVGADVNLAELGETTEQQAQQTLPGQQPVAQSADSSEPRFLFLPVEDHLTIPDVKTATRVGDYTATSNIGGRQQAGRLLGIDRVDFPLTAYFRPDFARSEPLGSLMNRLAAAPDGVLVSRAFLDRNSLDVGDPLRLTVGAAGDFADVDFRIVGAVDLFPTHYPDEGPLFVANLDYVHQGLGGQYPYNVWLRTTGERPLGALVNDVRALGIAVVTSQDARAQILAAQLAPERQGVFGLLTVGFMAAAALTVLGFLVYAVVSFQRRFIELGMLRAIGLSVGQMSGYLAAEQALVIAAGMGLGTAVGVVASRIFIPFLQVGSGAAAQVPPFIVQIAWDQILTIYALFGIMFVVAVAVLLLLLVRMKVFEAVKLGETI